MASCTDIKKWKPRKVPAKRDFPVGFYDVTHDESASKLIKKHKVCESAEGAEKGLFEHLTHKNEDFIPLETEPCVPSESCGSVGDIIPRMVNAETRGSEDEERAKFGAYTELKFPGVCLKEIRCYQMEDGLKIELRVDNLQKNGTNESGMRKDRV